MAFWNEAYKRDLIRIPFKNRKMEKKREKWIFFFPQFLSLVYSPNMATKLVVTYNSNYPKIA